MIQYNWQQSDWPHFRYDLTVIDDLLLKIAEKTGYIRGKVSHLTEHMQTEAMITMMVEEAVKSSEIEGEYINRADIRSSIINMLGLQTQKTVVRDKRATGIAEMMLDVRHTFKKALSQTKLFDWHLMLMSGNMNSNLRVGYWRTDNEPMQIVSGYHDKWKVHFEVPPASALPTEMQQFIRWFNHTAPGKPQAIKHAVVRAAIAHLYFESIHPFADGNGRIGRAIAEKALSQGFGYPVVLSLSQAMEEEKKEYYLALNAASKSNEITAWLKYFATVILRAQSAVELQINFIINKAMIFDKFQTLLNERQLKVIKRMLQAGIEGFKGGMSAKKYMIITGTSKATATRDLHELFELKILNQTGSGRSVRYELNLTGINH